MAKRYVIQPLDAADWSALHDAIDFAIAYLREDRLTRKYIKQEHGVRKGPLERRLERLYPKLNVVIEL